MTRGIQARIQARDINKQTQEDERTDTHEMTTGGGNTHGTTHTGE